METQAQGADQQQSENIPKPPPVFINNVSNISALITQLKTTCSSGFKHLTTEGKLTIITFEKIDDYRKTVPSIFAKY